MYELSTETIQNIPSVFNGLVLGANYWFVTAIQDDKRHLFLSPTTADPTGEQILSNASAVEPPLENITVGFATYTDTGVFRFASNQDDATLITDLIYAVQNQALNHSFLYHLVGAEFVYRSDDETTVYNEDEKWSNVLKYDISTLSDIVGSAAPGERFWASFQEEEVDSSPLVLIPMALDLTQIQFRRAVQANAVNGKLPPIGFAEWNGEQFNIFLTHPSKGIMKPFFKWLAKIIASHPTLSNLHGAQIYRLEADGTIRAAPMKMEAWAKLDVTEQRHQMHSMISETLSNVGPNDKYWMLYNIDAKILVLSSVLHDPRKETLMQRWVDVSYGQDATPSPGLAVITPRSGLIMMVNEQRSHFRQLLIEIAHNANAFPAAQQLILASIQPLLGGGSDSPTTERTTVDEVFLSLNDALSSVENEKEYWFWFAERTKDNSPILALFDATDDPQRKQLKEWMDMAPKAKNVVVGKSTYNGGAFVFKSRSPSNNFLTILSSWAAEHREQCPSLVNLNNATFIYKDKSTGEVHLQENNALWQ